MVSGGAAWPGGKWGHCGDPAAGPLRHEAGGAMWLQGGGGKPAAEWRAGSVVTLTSRITAFHKGRLGFRICRIQGTGALLCSASWQAAAHVRGAAHRGVAAGGREPVPAGAAAGGGAGIALTPAGRCSQQRAPAPHQRSPPIPALISPAPLPHHTTPHSWQADVASERAQLTEACLEAGVLRQADVPGAQAPGDRWLHLGQQNTGGGLYNASVQLPAVSCPVVWRPLQLDGAGGVVWEQRQLSFSSCLQSAAAACLPACPPTHPPTHPPVCACAQDLVCDGVTAKCVLQWYYLTGARAGGAGGRLALRPAGRKWHPRA